MSRISKSVARRFIPATIGTILFALVVTQAASFACGAQCLQHHQASQPAAAMTHCHAMHEPTKGITGRTCPSSATAFCVIDLLANNQQKILVQPTIHAAALSATLIPILTVAADTPVSPRLRSPIGDPPLLTPLRV